MSRALRLGAALALGAAAGLCQAGRPLETDDAGVAETGSCQVEAWREQGRPGHADVLAAACSPQDDLEFGVQASRSRLGGERATGGALSLKWAPGAAGALETPLGALSLGLALEVAGGRDGGTAWRRQAHAASLLATLEATRQLNLHANLVFAHERAAGTEPSLRLAAEWNLHPAAMLFAETRLAHREAGGSTVAVGGRHWLQPERLALDLTARRESAGGVAWGLGLGWYGLR